MYVQSRALVMRKVVEGLPVATAAKDNIGFVKAECSDKVAANNSSAALQYRRREPRETAYAQVILAGKRPKAAAW